MPKINIVNIDDIVNRVNSGICNRCSETLSKYWVTLTEGEQITGISRQTLYRWVKIGIIEIRKSASTGKNGFDIIKLRDDLMYIRHLHG
jgi:predicted DNA-binding ArsR family transcriptional regulator